MRTMYCCRIDAVGHYWQVPLEGLHTDRDRAESFGSVAERYDRFRPDYPDQLIDGLMRARPVSALDVGCGTGKVALSLARRGVGVLGVDPDERMASIARRHGVPVEISSFEDWIDAGRHFDLIVSGHAWHWVDPRQGVPKASRLLRPGGAIARFWNYHAVDVRLLAEFESIYREIAPDAHVIGRDPGELPDAHDPFSEDRTFRSTESVRYRWNQTLTADKWAGLIGTFGDHMQLGVERLAALQEALTASINRGGGVVDVRGGTYLLLAYKAR